MGRDSVSMTRWAISSVVVVGLPVQACVAGDVARKPTAGRLLLVVVWWFGGPAFAAAQEPGQGGAADLQLLSAVRKAACQPVFLIGRAASDCPSAVSCRGGGGTRAATEE